MNDAFQSGDPDILAAALHLQIAINVLKVHQPENDAAARAVKRLLESIHAAFLQDDQCQIVTGVDQVFVNGERVRNLSEVQELRELFDRMEIGGVSFVSPPEEQALAHFVIALGRHESWAPPDEAYVEPVPFDLDADGGGGDRRPEAIYRKAVDEISELSVSTF